jgi:hypothetical protein
MLGRSETTWTLSMPSCSLVNADDRRDRDHAGRVRKLTCGCMLENSVEITIYSTAQVVCSSCRVRNLHCDLTLVSDIRIRAPRELICGLFIIFALIDQTLVGQNCACKADLPVAHPCQLRKRRPARWHSAAVSEVRESLMALVFGRLLIALILSLCFVAALAPRVAPAAGVTPLLEALASAYRTG